MGIPKGLKTTIALGMVAQFLFVAPMKAQMLDELKFEEKQTNQEIAELESTIAEKLASINEKRATISSLEEQIEAAKVEKVETEAQIAETKVRIAQRIDKLQERLVSLQTSGAASNRLLLILQADGLVDFFSRMYLVGQLQAADQAHMQQAMDEQASLLALEENLEQKIASIESDSLAVATETDAMSGEIGSLQTLLSENKESLTMILSAQTNERNRLEEVARKEQEEKALAESIALVEQAKAVEQKRVEESRDSEVAKEEAASEEESSASLADKEESQPTPPSTPEPAQPAPPTEKPEVEEPATPPSSHGRVLSVSATAYSRHEPGLGNITATGIDLSINPIVIAVDPSVIPLGSLVDVPGYGIAIAGDTGGAIKGHKIDLHMEDLAAAHAYGRKQLTITVLD